MRKLSSALSVYNRHTERQNNLDDVSRQDMHFRFKDGSDIVIEETILHTRNPFKLTVKDIVEWSLSQDENLGNIISNQKEYYDGLKSRLDNECTLTYKPYFNVDGYDNLEFSSTDEMIKALRERINYLRVNDDSLEAYSEILHRRANLWEILYILNGKNLENPILKTYGDELTLTNQITVLQSVYEEEPKPNLKEGERYTPYSHQQRIYSIGEIIEMTTDPSIALREKTNRPLVLSNTTGRRIIGDNLYAHWNGLQIFDIDLKFSKLYMDNPHLTAEEHRDIVFDKLKHYPWLLGVTLSASHRAIHIYTKVSKMHDLYDDEDYNAKIQKFWYRVSYIQKYSAIAYVLDKHCGITDVYTGNITINKAGRKQTSHIIDGAMAKPSQGIAINYDPQGKWSSGFIEMYPCFLYHTPPEKGINIEDWLLKPEVKEKFNSWFYDFTIFDKEAEGITVEQKNLNIVIDDTIQVDGVTQIDMSQLAKGERHNTRWRVCNTIMYAFGDTEKARELCHHILQSNQDGTVGQVNAFIRTALIHRKEADISTIKLLKGLGVKIGLDEESQQAISEEVLDKVEFDLANNDYNFLSTNPDAYIKLEDNEYLGMKMNVVLNAFKDFKINVIESSPNTGKTEFFKALAKTEPVCLVIPYTSTIESKIIGDESINALFDVYYGDRSISELKKGRSAVMTFDKFASMPKSRYSMFKYVAFDESHLFFTSTYRLPVVSQTIENIRTYLLEDSIEKQKSLSMIHSFQNAMNLISGLDEINRITSNSDTTKFIMMSGTLTGELDYFKYYGLLNYIKVHKKHPHNKNLTIHLSKTKETIEIKLIEKIIESLESGKKVIHPTNRGDNYAKQIEKCVAEKLGREIKTEYYKRANNDEEFMEYINQDTTMKDVELLFCSDYLSVGIDIKDKGEFTLVFASDFTSESIEQFNNRLRSTNIDCHIYYDVVDDMGMLKPNIINTNHIRYEHNDEMKNMIRDEQSIAELQKTINVKQQLHVVLGELFSKYFIEDFGGKIKYIKSAFEIEQFERQYTNIAKSLLYIKTAMVNKYQYNCSVVKHEEISEDKIEKYDKLRKDAKDEHDILKSQSFRSIVDFLSSNDVYEIMKQRDVVYIKDNLPIEEGGTDLHLGFDSNYLGGSYVITWNKKHKYSLDEAKSFVKKIRRLYSQETVLKIIDDNTRESGLIQKIELKRYLDLMQLVFTDKKHTLSESTRNLLEQTYNYVTPDEEVTIMERFDYDVMKLEIRNSMLEDFKDITEKELQSERRLEDMNKLTSKFIDTIFMKRVGKKNVTLEYRRIYSFDSDTVQESIEFDKIYRQILFNEVTVNHDHMETFNLSEMHIDDYNIGFNTNLMAT